MPTAEADEFLAYPSCQGFNFHVVVTGQTERIARSKGLASLKARAQHRLHA